MSASATANIFASHIKTICAKPYIFGTKNIWVWGNVLDYLSMTLMHNKVRTTHLITTRLGNSISLVMLITWLDVGKILLKTFFCKSLKILDVFFQCQTLFWTHLGNSRSNCCETKRKCIGWILGILCELELWPHS